MKLVDLGVKLQWAVDLIRKKIFARMEEGFTIECPCCSQTAKIYKRSISSTMVRQLIVICKASRSKWADHDNWVNVNRFYLPGASGDYAKLRFWGLIEPMDVRTRGFNSSGMWRITDEGREFVKGDTRVRKHLFIYNNALYEIDGTDAVGRWLDIHEALGSKFNYATLMNAPLRTRSL
ncbi:MAG: hypothetical protein DRQ64_00295 [Gammaproteobacteria bacterium]|nr:MAG: hypothetical protein DRQ64_00295 [Gammaproteobacteria bacterium]